ENQWHYVRLQRLKGRTDDHEPPAISEPTNRRRHRVRVRHRRQDRPGTAQLLERLRHVFLRAVDVVLGAQLVCEVGVVLPARDSHGVEPHLRRALAPEIPESAHAATSPAVTPSPIASTRPTTSCPGTRGYVIGKMPSLVTESLWQIPQDCTRTRTSPAFGSGTSRVTNSIGPPLVTTCAYRPVIAPSPSKDGSNLVGSVSRSPRR